MLQQQYFKLLLILIGKVLLPLTCETGDGALEELSTGRTLIFFDRGTDPTSTTTSQNFCYRTIIKIRILHTNTPYHLLMSKQCLCDVFNQLKPITLAPHSTHTGNIRYQYALAKSILSSKTQSKYEIDKGLTFAPKQNQDPLDLPMTC